MRCVHTGPMLDLGFGPRGQPNWSFLERRTRQPAAWTPFHPPVPSPFSNPKGFLSVHRGWRGGGAGLVAVAAHFQDPVPSRMPLATCEY